MKAKILLILAAALAAAQVVQVPILADVAHGEITKGLDLWVNKSANPLAISDFAQLHILIPPEGRPDPVLARINASRLAVFLRGDFSTVDLSRFKVIILGQPPRPLSEAELAALKKWFESGGRVLWCAADSDYPAQGSEESQAVCNDIAEYIGSRLRVDYVSVEDARYNIGGAGYRVIGVVDPPPQLAFLGFMASRVMFHGPGAVAVVLPDGRWVPATSPEVARHYNNIHVLVRTTENGIIVEHRTSADGKGRDGRAHKAGDRGVFALMAVEFMANGSVFIISGETPYGGYEPTIAWIYRGVELDGNRFLRNVMQWATGNYRELSTIVSQHAQIQRVANAVADVSAKIDALRGEINNVRAAVQNSQAEVLNRVGRVESEVTNAAAQIKALNEKIEQLNRKLDAAVAEANNAKTVAFVGTALALIFAIAAAVLAVRKSNAAQKGETKTR